MSTGEIWRAVPSIPGLYASTEGRLQIRGFTQKMRNGRVLIRDSKPGIGQWDGSRYIYVLRGKTYKVARLVCEAFHGSPFPKAVCMHLDECSRNNKPNNLQWGTQKENLNAPGFIKYCQSRTGENSSWTKGMKRKQVTP